jgi:hypothetical protein
MSVSPVSFGPTNLEKDWMLVDPNINAYDRANDYAIKKRVEVLKDRFLDAGRAVAAAAMACRLGGFLLEHGAAFYAFVQIAPKTVLEQYIYANAIHELAMSILNFTVFGVSASTLATIAVAIIAGVLVTKLGIFIYNLRVEKEWQINLSLIGTIQSIFWRK